MRVFGLPLLVPLVALAQPRVDNVLIKMAPPGTTSLVGAHMDQIKSTELYKRLIATQQLPQLDQFARETGFDPRRDVREWVLAGNNSGSVLLARGSFHVDESALGRAKKMRHGQYDIWAAGKDGGFCILDATLAAAGPIPAIEAALDEWTTGKHTTGPGLLERIKTLNPDAQFWGVSDAAGDFLANHLPEPASGPDFSNLFRGLENVWFEADFSAGLKADVHGLAASEQKAVSLRDAIRGVVGFARLSVPENKPELLRLWDGVTATQQGRAVTVNVDISSDLIQKLIEIMGAGSSPAPQRL